jgi:hypothetical protein
LTPTPAEIDKIAETFNAADAGSPAGEGPYSHALLSTASAPAYLSIPTGAELVELLVRGILVAIPAVATEAIGPVV